MDLKGFIAIVVRKGTIAEVIQTLIREVVVILEEKQKTEDMEDIRTL